MSGSLLRAPILTAITGVDHAFETRAGDLSSALPGPVARLGQVHGSHVESIGEGTDLTPFLADAPTDRPAADALVTARPEVTLTVATADCLPVLIADRDGAAVAAAHAGWRGLALGILPGTLGVLAREHGVLPGSVIVVLGPAVGACCYRVGDDVRTAFAAAGIADGAFSEPRDEEADRTGEVRTTWGCDLGAAARTQLLHDGVDDDRIVAIDRCTRCDADAFHSYRRDGDAAGRQLSGIAIRP